MDGIKLPEFDRPPRSRRRFMPRPAVLPTILLSTLGASLPFIINGCLQDEVRRPEPIPAPVVPRNQVALIDRTVRVRLLGQRGCDSFTLAVNGPFVIEDLRTGRILEDSARESPRRTLTPVMGGVAGIRWGNSILAADLIRISPVYDGTLIVKESAYRGSLLVQRDGEKLVVTNLVDVEDYLRGVLIGELPRTFHPDAFAALAVAARTYVLYQKQHYGAKRSFDVLPDERSQMYLGRAGERAIADEAVARTRGLVCTLPDDSGGGLFCTYYSSCCGGMSQSLMYVKPSEPLVAPLLGNVVCTTCSEAPVFKWDTLRLSKAELTKRVVARYPSLAKLGPITRFEATAPTADGRFTQVKLTGAEGKTNFLVGEDFRLAVGGRQLRSTRCKLIDDRDGVIFSGGRGFGHGMGLCQYGANGLARQGRDFREIINFYYPGSVIRRLP